MSNDQGSPNRIVMLLLGVVVGVAVGVGISMMMAVEGSSDGARGEWHDSPSPQTSPERTVQMNLTEIRVLTNGSSAAENPQKDAIQQKLIQLSDPAFAPMDPVDAASRVHNAWKYATKGIWASVHEELEPIN